MNKIEQDIISLRFFLNGNKYYKASRALEVALWAHDGLRKDGQTPEYYHQLCIAHYLRTITGHLIWSEETIATGLLHDVIEDHPDKMNKDELYRRFGLDISDAVELLTKTGKEPSHYFDKLTNNCIASIVKGADRMHNFQSMVGVFKQDKQIRYITETEEFIIPMLERSARRWPEQEPAYANITLVLQSQIELIRHIHKASQP